MMFNKLDLVEDLVSASKVCRDWYLAANAPTLWANFYQWKYFKLTPEQWVTVLQQSRFSQLKQLRAHRSLRKDVTRFMVLLSECAVKNGHFLRSLKRLDLQDCAFLQSVGVEAICTLTQLTCLSLKCTGVINADLEKLPSLVNLTSLDLSKCIYINDEGVSLLSSLPRLKYLSLAGTRVNFSLNIPPLTVQTLNLSNCLLPESSSVKIPNTCPKLKELTLMKPSLSLQDSWWRSFLQHATTLQHLNVGVKYIVVIGEFMPHGLTVDFFIEIAH